MPESAIFQYFLFIQEGLAWFEIRAAEFGLIVVSVTTFDHLAAEGGD